MKEIIQTHAWLTLQEHVVLELAADANLKVTEGELFAGLVKWCQANTATEDEAIIEFQKKFADKIIAKNINEGTFLNNIGPSNFLSSELFKKWTFEMLQSKVRNASRRELNPCKVLKFSLVRKDLSPVSTSLFRSITKGKGLK